jgi:hypothetical protein
MLRAKKKIRILEKQFLAKAGTAFAAAWKKAQSSGQGVVISERGAIYEIFPDGNRQLLKTIEPPIRVKAGRKVLIR